jgi:hypothetical protein
MVGYVQIYNSTSCFYIIFAAGNMLCNIKHITNAQFFLLCEKKSSKKCVFHLSACVESELAFLWRWLADKTVAQHSKTLEQH